MDYPPADDAEESLAGLGVPDMQGTFGTFTFFTDDAGERRAKCQEDVSRPYASKISRAILRVTGPVNPFRADARAAGTDIAVDLDPAQPIARFTWGKPGVHPARGRMVGLDRGGFPAALAIFARGMFRVYAKQLAGGFGVYVSPVNIDPAKPEAKISAPASFSARLAQAAGLYYTQGIPQDTAALRQHVFDRAEYLAQSRMRVARATGVIDARAGRLPWRPALLPLLRRGSGFAHAVAQDSTRICSIPIAWWMPPSAKCERGSPMRR